MTAELRPVPIFHLTGRLVLRQFEQRDTPALYSIQSDQEAMCHTYAANSLRQCEERLSTFEDLRPAQGFAPWVVIERASGRVIGWGGLNVDPFDPGWGVEVSYFFDPAVWGRGFGTELVSYSVKHAFADLALSYVIAFAKPDNVGSIRVLEKCGFSFTNYEPRIERNQYRIQRAEFGQPNKPMLPDMTCSPPH